MGDTFIFGLLDYGKYGQHLYTYAWAEAAERKRRYEKLTSRKETSKTALLMWKFMCFVRNPRIIACFEKRRGTILERIYTFCAYDLLDCGIMQVFKLIYKNACAASPKHDPEGPYIAAVLPRIAIERGNHMNIKQTKPYLAARTLFYSLKHWDKTYDDWKLYRGIRPLKDTHNGQACVVIGNGPSLKVEDLTKLHELGIPTFACNRIHLIFPQTPWRPSYYFMSDEKLVKQYDDNVPDVPVQHRFFPKQYRNVIRNGRFYNTIEFDYEHEGKFSLDAAKGVCPAASVTTEMIQFAYYMGFSEIYLIGVDFSYAVTQKVDSKTYAYQGENNYFIPGYLKPGEVADMPNVNANLLGFHAAKEAIEAQGRTIKNATRGGKLEVFNRVSLDDLFAKWEAERK